MRRKPKPRTQAVATAEALRPCMPAGELLDWAMQVAGPCGDNTMGLCIACGAEHAGCEPDTRRRTCDSCGEPAVYGAEELVIRLADLID